MVIYPLKMVIFHSYVSLPEGTAWFIGLVYIYIYNRKIEPGKNW